MGNTGGTAITSQEALYWVMSSVNQYWDDYLGTVSYNPVSATHLKTWHPYPNSKVYGTNMGSTWVLLAPDGPHVGPMTLAIRVDFINGCPVFKWFAVTLLKIGDKDSFSSNGCHSGILFYTNCKTSCISHTKSQNLNVSHLVLQLSLLNPLKPDVKSSMKM